MSNNKTETRLYMAGLILIGLGLRMFALGNVEFWYDEGFSVLLAKSSFWNMLTATAGDTHPPLFYVIMWVWGRLFGFSEFAFRLPAVLAGVATIPIGWLVAGQFGANRPARWVVAGMLALSPFEIYFGQEARMYTMLQLAFLVGVWAIMAPELVRYRWIIGGANLALLYLHNYGLFYVATLGLLALVKWRNNNLSFLHTGLLMTFGIPGLLYLPWFIVLLRQMVIVSSGYWIEPVSVGQIVYTLTIALFGPFVRQWILLAAPVSVGILIFSAVRLGPDRRWWPVWGMALAPLVMAVGTSLAWKPMYLFRGLIGSVPFVYLLIGQALFNIPRPKRWYVVGMMIPLLAIGMTGYWLDIRGFKSTTLDAIHRIQTEWQPGDMLVASNDGNWVMFSVYQAEPVYLLPPCDEHDRGALSSLTREALGVTSIPIEALPARRIWFLWNWGAPTSKCNYDRAAGLVHDKQPYWVVEENDYSSAAIWLLR